MKEKFPAKDILLMPNPFYYAGKIQPVKPRSGREYIAWLGIFSYQKNLPALYQVVQALPNLQFKIAGIPVNELDQKSQEALDYLNAAPNVEFTGFLKRAEVIDFLARAFLLLNTSHYEGFSNTFLEAFAVGTPVVTLHQNDPDDIIMRHNLGAIASDYQEIPESIKVLLNNDAFDNICESCQQYLQKNHDPVMLAKAMANCLERQLN